MTTINNTNTINQMKRLCNGKGNCKGETHSVIYKITNTKNQKDYYGYVRKYMHEPQQEILKHIFRAAKKARSDNDASDLFKAINKHGKDHFIIDSHCSYLVCASIEQLEASCCESNVDEYNIWKKAKKDNYSVAQYKHFWKADEHSKKLKEERTKLKAELSAHYPRGKISDGDKTFIFEFLAPNGGDLMTLYFPYDKYDDPAEFSSVDTECQGAIEQCVAMQNLLFPLGAARPTSNP